MVLSAPRAFIKINNQIAGFVRNLTFSENINRVNVQGLGNLVLQEVPAVGLQCTWNVDQFFIDFKKPEVEGMVRRLGSVKEVIDTLVFGELGFAIAIYSKTVTAKNETTGMVTNVDPTGSTIMLLNPCFVTTQNFSLAEGGVAGYNVSGYYINPITTGEL